MISAIVATVPDDELYYGWLAERQYAVDVRSIWSRSWELYRNHAGLLLPGPRHSRFWRRHLLHRPALDCPLHDACQGYVRPQRLRVPCQRVRGLRLERSVNFLSSFVQQTNKHE